MAFSGVFSPGARKALRGDLKNPAAMKHHEEVDEFEEEGIQVN